MGRRPLSLWVPLREGEGAALPSGPRSLKGPGPAWWAKRGASGWWSLREWAGGCLELPALSSHCTQGLALTHVLEQNLKPVAGLRPEAAKLVILVTDGKSQDDARTAGHMLKGLGVDVFAVGKQTPGSHGEFSQQVAPTHPPPHRPRGCRSCGL